MMMMMTIILLINDNIGYNMMMITITNCFTILFISFQVLCSGRGTCECGKCACNETSGYSGEFCSECKVSI